MLESFSRFQRTSQRKLALDEMSVIVPLNFCNSRLGVNSPIVSATFSCSRRCVYVHYVNLAISLAEAIIHSLPYLRSHFIVESDVMFASGKIATYYSSNGRIKKNISRNDWHR